MSDSNTNNTERAEEILQRRAERMSNIATNIIGFCSAPRENGNKKTYTLRARENMFDENGKYIPREGSPIKNKRDPYQI